MSKETMSNGQQEPKETLGKKMRKIADKLQQETELQIKATARILGAAAQISQNHEKLISEVADMIENDIDRQTHMEQDSIFTTDNLKNQFKNLNQAKAHFNLKANSWDALAKKLNLQNPGNPQHSHTSQQNDTSTLIFKQLDHLDAEVNILREEVHQILLLLQQSRLDESK